LKIRQELARESKKDKKEDLQEEREKRLEEKRRKEKEMFDKLSYEEQQKEVSADLLPSHIAVGAEKEERRKKEDEKWQSEGDVRLEINKSEVPITLTPRYFSSSL
jgi:hypothetical protein